MGWPKAILRFKIKKHNVFCIKFCQIRMMKRFEDPPHFLILHVSGNDLGAVKVGFLRNNIKKRLFCQDQDWYLLGDFLQL
jgi:hypothetical protein